MILRTVLEKDGEYHLSELYKCIGRISKHHNHHFFLVPLVHSFGWISMKDFVPDRDFGPDAGSAIFIIVLPEK